MTNINGLFRILVALSVMVYGESCFAVTVAKVLPDGKGDFATIQAAIDAVPARNTATVVIEIGPGRYNERLTIPKNKPFITLRGMGNIPADVWIGSVIQNARAVVAANASDFRCEHLTISEQRIVVEGQAQAAVELGGVRQVLEDCEISGTQHIVSIPSGGQAYLHCCKIVGSDDIIFGSGTAFLDTCDVFVTGGKGVIAMPITLKTLSAGLVFTDCHFSGSSANEAALMRPWGPDGAAAFIRCSVDQHFTRAGWRPWEGHEATCRAEEFATTTPDDKPLDLSERPRWVRQLSAEESRRYILASVYGGWNPHASEPQ
jgi:pectinesterase